MARLWRRKQFHTLFLLGIQNGSTPWRKILQYQAKLHIYIYPYIYKLYIKFNLAIPLLGIYPKEIRAKIENDIFGEPEWLCQLSI